MPTNMTGESDHRITIQMIAQSVLQVHLSSLKHKLCDQFVGLLDVGQVIFMLHLFLDIWRWGDVAVW